MSESHKDLSERKSVIRKLRERKEKLGRSPSQGDADGSLVYAARKHFGSWNRAKEKAGLKTFGFGSERGKNWSREKVINGLRKLADELGRPPVMTDDSRLAGAAREYFGSWNCAKEEAGLKTFGVGNTRGKSWSREKIIDELEKLADNLGRSPVMADNPSLAAAASRYFGSWNVAKEKAGLRTFKSAGGKRRSWSKERVIDELKRLADELSRSPVTTDAPNLANAANKYFDSWNAAKEKAGLETFKSIDEREKNWSREKIVVELKELADELGRSPVAADDPNLARAARDYFGSWNAAKEKVGLKTFSKGFPHDRDSTKYTSGGSEKIEMVKLSVRISNLTNADKIRPLARGLARLKGIGVDHLDDLVDWAECEARSILKQYPEYYLQIQDGWAEKTYDEIKSGEELGPDTQSSRPDSTTEVKA